LYELASLQIPISLIPMGGSLFIRRNIFNQDSDTYQVTESSVTSALPCLPIVTLVKCNNINLSKVQVVKCGNKLSGNTQIRNEFAFFQGIWCQC